MDPNIFVGIAVVFLSAMLNVGAVLVGMKVLHHVFDWEDKWERKNYPKEYWSGQ